MSKFAAINSKSAKQGKSKTMVPSHNSMAHVHAPGTVPMFNQQKIDEEVARAVQQILSIQNEQTETGDDNIYLNSNEIVPSNDLSTSVRSVSGNSDIEDISYKTPESSVPTIDTNVGKKPAGKSTKRSRQSQITNQGELTSAATKYDFQIPSTSSAMQSTKINSEHNHMDGLLQQSPKRGRSELETTIDARRNLKQVLATPNESNNAKYQKIGHDEGTIISAYYTLGHEEKLQEFQPVYINIGNPNQAKELIGLKKNTKFVSLGKKTQHESANYLVVSFENRKKSNSPFIEYPLSRLDMVIKALMELKEYAISRNYYKEVPILNCKYPESTTLNAHDDKDTVLETLV